MRVARLEQQSRHTRAGKLADVVAVRGNPLEDIKVPKSFVFVTGVAKDLPQRPLWHPIAPALIPRTGSYFIFTPGIAA